MNEKVKQALENVKNIKVGCMVLNDLFGEELCVIEQALNNYEEDKKELIAEQHRLFDLAKEQENELNELKEFAKVISRSVEVNEFGSTDAHYNNANVINKDTIVDEEVDLVKKVVEKYGKEKIEYPLRI